MIGFGGNVTKLIAQQDYTNCNYNDLEYNILAFVTRVGSSNTGHFINPNCKYLSFCRKGGKIDYLRGHIPKRNKAISCKKFFLLQP